MGATAVILGVPNRGVYKAAVSNYRKMGIKLGHWGSGGGGGDYAGLLHANLTCMEMRVGCEAVNDTCL